MFAIIQTWTIIERVSEIKPKWLLENFEAARIELPTSNFHSFFFYSSED